ncbi:NIDogen [Aphelenchoides besseyi]|nr:NIDogen [Aphelenchoides besseyi]
MRRFITWTFLIQLVGSSLIPYGEPEGDKYVPHSSGLTATVLNVPFVYFGQEFTQIYLSVHGFVSFGETPPTDIVSLRNQTAIAVYYTKTVGGNMYYRIDNRPNSKPKSELMEKFVSAFDNARQFNATEIVLVTWEDMQGVNANGHNIFQVGLLTNGTDSYAVLIYSRLDYSESDGRYAELGFFSSDGRSEPIFNTGTSSASEVAKLTMMSEKGVYSYRTSVKPELGKANVFGGEEYEYENDDEYSSREDQPENCPFDEFKDECPEDCNIVSDSKGCRKCICGSKRNDELAEPEQISNTDHQNAPSLLPDTLPQQISPIQSRNPTSECSLDAREGAQCHAYAFCEPLNGGYCCRCGPDYIGNGHDCLNRTPSVRVGGSFEGVINGKKIEKTDLYAFIDTTTGQQHTVISGISEEFGWSLQLLDSIANIMSWLFGKIESSDVQNGFRLTGGVFNRSLNIHLGEQYVIAVRQTFTGREGDLLRVDIFVSGTLPTLESNAEVSFTDFDDKFSHEEAGFFRAYADRHLIVRQGEQEVQHRVTADQQIRFKECAFGTSTTNKLTIVRVSRITGSYAPKERTLRFGSQIALYNSNDAVAATERNNNPCLSQYNLCNQPNMFCKPENRQYRCECEPGFQVLQDDTVEPKFRCVGEKKRVIDSNKILSTDANECARNPCDRNADCENTVGSYNCRCREGFNGDGKQCTRNGDAPVKTDAGYECTSHAECHQWGECAFTSNSRGVCKCRGWYVGDGRNNCGPPTAETRPEQCGQYTCDVNADCIDETCICRSPGYQGTGLTCAPIVQQERGQNRSPDTVCRGDNECGVNARCVYNGQLNYYRCECVSPFYNNGVECVQDNAPRTVVTCEQRLNCDPNAQCVSTGGHPPEVCQCLQNYEGNGTVCVTRDEFAKRLPIDERHECVDQQDCHEFGRCTMQETSGGRFYCECLPGYRGDGHRHCIKSEECDVVNPHNCPEHSQCQFAAEKQTYTCQCHVGYTRQNDKCVPIQIATAESCNTSPHICHRNAYCQHDQLRNEWKCKCRDQYYGDGVENCSAQPVAACACGPNAECVQHPTHGNFSCFCRSGFAGDGYDCKRVSSCLDDRSLCSPNAQCVPDQRGYYVCHCNFGFNGNGYECNPVKHNLANPLLIARGMSIIHRSTDVDTPGRQVVVKAHQVVVGLDYDCISERIYWSDISGFTIRSSTLNGTDIKDVYSDNLRSPEGIAIDWTSRNLYYADSIKDEIGVITLDGRYQKALLTEGLVNPRALAIDIENRVLYYSDWYRRNPRIGRMDLDGRNNRDFINTDIELPNGLTILPRRRELCWVDAGKKQLSCVRFDGTGRRVVHAPLEYPFGLTHENEERFYWTDWKDHQIHSISINGDQPRSFAPSVAGQGKIYGILSQSPQCHGKQTECSNNNGGCEFICLPSQHGAKCV